MSKDRSTVVSIVPFALSEYKPGLFPAKYEIPAAASMDDPEILVVRGCYFFVDVPEHPQRSFKIETSSEKLAHSIVFDFLDSQLAIDRDTNAMPGIFYIPEEVPKSMIKQGFRKELAQAKENQTNWFLNLVKMADDDFQMARKHEVVSGVQRQAARALGLERDWLLDIQKINQIATKTCPVCTSQILEKSIVCPTCRAILNDSEYKKFSFAA